MPAFSTVLRWVYQALCCQINPVGSVRMSTRHSPVLMIIGCLFVCSMIDKFNSSDLEGLELLETKGDAKRLWFENYVYIFLVFSRMHINILLFV